MISAVSRTYDELEVGAVYRSRFGRTVLEADNVWFTLLTMNTNPIPFDAAYAAGTQWEVEKWFMMDTGSRGHGPGHRHAAQELAEEVQGRTPLLPAGPPHRHQHGLRPSPYPGPVAAPDLAQEDPEANRQLGP